MEKIYCWRCKKDVPMLNEEEYSEVSRVYRNALGASKEFHNKQNPEGNDPILEFYTFYENFIGESISTFAKRCSIVISHRISEYGSACKNCSKLLRTPRASFCAACGATKD